MVIENGTILKLGFGSHSIATMTVSLAVSTQYTKVTDRHRTTAQAALMHASRGSNNDDDNGDNNNSNNNNNNVVTVLICLNLGLRYRYGFRVAIRY